MSRKANNCNDNTCIKDFTTVVNSMKNNDIRGK